VGDKETITGSRGDSSRASPRTDASGSAEPDKRKHASTQKRKAEQDELNAGKIPTTQGHAKTESGENADEGEGEVSVDDEEEKEEEEKRIMSGTGADLTFRYFILCTLASLVLLVLLGIFMDAASFRLPPFTYYSLQAVTFYPIVLAPSVIVYVLVFSGCTKQPVKMHRARVAVYNVVFFTFIHMYALDTFEVRIFGGKNHIFHATHKVNTMLDGATAVTSDDEFWAV
jgi:hypothetical protein